MAEDKPTKDQNLSQGDVLREVLMAKKTESNAVLAQQLATWLQSVLKDIHPDQLEINALAWLEDRQAMTRGEIAAFASKFETEEAKKLNLLLIACAADLEKKLAAKPPKQSDVLRTLLNISDKADVSIAAGQVASLLQYSLRGGLPKLTKKAQAWLEDREAMTQDEVAALTERSVRGKEFYPALLKAAGELRERLTTQIAVVPRNQNEGKSMTTQLLQGKIWQEIFEQCNLVPFTLAEKIAMQTGIPQEKSGITVGKIMAWRDDQLPMTRQDIEKILPFVTEEMDSDDIERLGLDLLRASTALKMQLEQAESVQAPVAAKTTPFVGGAESARKPVVVTAQGLRKRLGDELRKNRLAVTPSEKERKARTNATTRELKEMTHEDLLHRLEKAGATLPEKPAEYLTRVEWGQADVGPALLGAWKKALKLDAGKKAVIDSLYDMLKAQIQFEAEQGPPAAGQSR